MAQKLDLYDILGILIPGLVLLVLVPQLFPTVLERILYDAYPDAFMVITLTALAVFVGHLVQALGSLIEPGLNLTWGGRPSEKALEEGLGDRYLPKDTAERIRKKLCETVGNGASTRSLFLYAMERSEGSGRTSRFNALYAYHRGLLVLWLVCCVVLAAALTLGELAGTSTSCKAVLMLGACALLLLIWFRAKQRALYYVREVLLTSEYVLNSSDRAAREVSQNETDEG